MKITCCAILIAAVCPVAIFGQETESLPLPIVSARSILPDSNTTDALTPAEKARLMLKNTFGARAVGNRLLIAGIDQWTDHPEEWPGGMKGFGMRFGTSMGRTTVRNSIGLATDVAFRIDPRFDRCNCEGARARTLHAWRRVVISRSDSGNEMPAISNFAGAVFTPMIVQPWHPDRLNTWSRKWESVGFELAMRGATNMLREFWPDMRRGMPFRRK